MIAADPACTTIPLTKGYCALVDAADYDDLRKYKWHAIVIRKKLIYAARIERVEGENGPRQKTVYMHRQVFGAVQGQFVDHRNRNTLDNRRSNLRACNRNQNAQNREAVVSACGFKGVTACKGRWYAYIALNGKRRHLGSFRSPEEAARAYDTAALELFGEFAATNEALGLLSARAA